MSATDDANLTCPTPSGNPLANASVSFQYDGMNRKIAQTSEDGTKQSWSYNGPTVAFTDEANHQWTRTSDALGRLTTVLEPAITVPTGGTGKPETDYVYDGFGNLLSVVQKGVSGEAPRTRAFTYNNLSQLITTTNPESAASGGISTCYGIFPRDKPAPLQTALAAMI